VVFAAAYGPLWSSGGDRGLYKTTDGGVTWTKVLEISEHTGVSDVAIDPRHPDVMLAVAHQRRRHTWTLIHGGPESGLHKSVDGGRPAAVARAATGGDLGRIIIAFSPRRPASSTPRSKRAETTAIYASSTRQLERRGNVQAQAMYKNIHRSEDADRPTCRRCRRRSPTTAADHPRSATQQTCRQPLLVDRSDSTDHCSKLRGGLAKVGRRHVVAPFANLW
jgi:hypothetical protein